MVLPDSLLPQHQSKHCFGQEGDSFGKPEISHHVVRFNLERCPGDIGPFISLSPSCCVLLFNALSLNRSWCILALSHFPSYSYCQTWLYVHFLHTMYHPLSHSPLASDQSMCIYNCGQLNVLNDWCCHWYLKGSPVRIGPIRLRIFDRRSWSWRMMGHSTNWQWEYLASS